ncbi:MAG: hypothetical protein K0R27_2797 [Xanthobacteraceae bacterium]|jgi:hypothetical protein|nr:hypothetical protein [Xanthobacteraceae bacterium]
MEPLEDWRSPQFEERLGRLDRGGISFEFLRRNRQYQQAYADKAGGHFRWTLDQDRGDRQLARRWGLAFPG